jgi:dTDP-4-dehydrorhamnose 3,5-epimerase
VAPLIDGVRVHEPRTIMDERGSLCEIYNPAWGFSEEPLVYAYQVTVRPNTVKGWILHREQDDRTFVSMGTGKFVLYDAREGSPTQEMLNEICLGAENRGILRIPKGVWHAVQNVGTSDLLFINLPTNAYRYEDPDKYRLPLDSDAIPYSF